MGLLSIILYNVCLLLGLLLLFPLWLGYLALVPKARAGFWEKLGHYSPALQQQLAQPRRHPKRVWFHAVSVGEFNAIKSLIAELQDEMDIVISTTTRTGHDLAQRIFPELGVLYFPYDLRQGIQNALQQVQPDLVVITETELWPNFIDMTTRVFQTPLILINGRLSQRSFQGYQRIRLLIAASLKQVHHFYMQSQADADRVQNLGQLRAGQVTVLGNLKFDLAPHIDAAQRARLQHLLNIHEDDTVLTFASTHSGEDLPLLETYLRLKKDFPELRLILAPRHPERLPELKNILNSKALNYAIRSQLSENQPNQQPIVILDSIGELMTVYSFSRIAVMGGSFVDKGGQNPLEPISQGIPVIFGPHMHNFAEISRLVLENEAGYQVTSQDGLVNAITSLLTQPEIYDGIAQNGQRLIESNRGAKILICKAIRQHLSK